jgi:UDP-glucose 4-epimerase
VGRVVLVTGVARDLGAEFAQRLAEDPTVDKVVGVDLRPPTQDLPGVTFVRTDTHNLVIGEILATAAVDTVVHLSVAALPGRGGARSSLKESNVIGTMQLLAACQRAPAVRKLVVKSATAVYGASPRDPALFTEGMGPRRPPSAGFAKDAAEVEGYLRGFCRRRPDVAVTTLRMANLLSSRLDTPLARYFRLPVLPTVLGFDPRLQFLHADDAFEVLRQATVQERTGTYNVAGDGILLLSQAVRRTGSPSFAVPSFAFAAAVRNLGGSAGSIGADLVALMTYGRGVDTTALSTSFGYSPAWSTADTLDAFVRDRGPGPLATVGLHEAEPSADRSFAGVRHG